MTAPRAAVLVLIVLASLLLAWWPWRGHLTATLGRIGIAARWIAIAALLALLIDPGAVLTGPRRPLVLLDNSISMHAAAGQADSAAALAARLGDVTRFGELSPGEPAGSSMLAASLSDAVAAGRPIVIVTDGEISDVDQIAPDLLAQAAVHQLRRERSPDISLEAIRAPTRLVITDTLTVEVDLLRIGASSDSVSVELKDGEQVLLRSTVVIPPGGERATLRLTGRLPAGTTGERWLQIVRTGRADLEADNDVRWIRILVTATPGIVVLVERPDWDGRFLYSTLDAVTESAVRGYVQVSSGRWRRMDDLRPVSVAEVRSAAGEADLLAIRGDTTGWSGLGRARLSWPAATDAGDWYVGPGSPSPLSGVMNGVVVDSMPPLPAVGPLPAGAAWTALTARRSRRGEARPILAGYSGQAREVLIAADGFYAWSFGGGAAEQVWRGLLAESAAWLLSVPARGLESIRPVSHVTQRGHSVRFAHTDGGGGDPIPIVFRSATDSITDSLRFDTEGMARVSLPVGLWRYAAAGDSGTLMVEPYSDELTNAPATLESRTAEVTPTAPRRSLRELLGFFLLAVVGFSVEWTLRRRMGLA